MLEQTEREEILRALEAHAGDVAKASEALGVGKSTLYRRMKELKIEEASGGKSG